MSSAKVNPIIDEVLLSAENRDNVDLYNDAGCMFNSINIYESINTQYVSGNIIILDLAGLLEGFPIAGDEYIKIAFRSYEEAPQYNKIFKIFKIDNFADLEGKRGQKYVLHFASAIMDNSQKKKLRISFEDKREDEIIKSICVYSLGIPAKLLDMEKTLYQRTFVVPNWSPLKTINYFTNTAVWEGPSRSPSFVFYEDNSGWKFKSIETMMKSEVTGNRLALLNIENTYTDFKPSNIINYIIEKNIDNIQNSQNGFYGSTSREVDLINKKVTDTTFTHQALHDEQWNIDKPKTKKAWPIRSTIGNDPKRKTIIVSNNGNNLHSFEIENKRAWFMQQFENYKINVNMFGDSGMVIGTKRYFDNRSIIETPREEENKYISGHFILTELWHTITPYEHKMMLTLRKPTFKHEIKNTLDGDIQ